MSPVTERGGLAIEDTDFCREMELNRVWNLLEAARITSSPYP